MRIRCPFGQPTIFCTTHDMCAVVSRNVLFQDCGVAYVLAPAKLSDASFNCTYMYVQP
jgi:hypothetical protein